MAFDKNQLFDDGSTAITQNGNSPNILQVGPGEYDVTMIVTEVSVGDSIQVNVWDNSEQILGAFPTVEAPGVYHCKVQTQHEELGLDYQVTGSDVSIKLVAGLTRGRDGGANA